MKQGNLGGAKNIDEYVYSKLKKFALLEHNYQSLYSMMFSETDNVIYEESNGYKIHKITYGECKRNAEGRASGLSALLDGVSHDSVVGMYLNNGVEWIETFWAILIAGYRPLLINMRLDDASINKALADTNAQAVISNGKTFPIKTILLNDLTPTDVKAKSNDFGTEIMVMSSGTSESIKVCAYTAEEFYHVIQDSRDIVLKSRRMKKHYKGELKLLAFLPFYHIFGLVAVYTWFAFFSRTFVALKDFSADTLIDTINRHKVTHIFAVPLFWQSVYNEAVKTIRARGDKTYKKFNKGLKISNRLGNSLIGRVFTKLAFREVRENLFGDSISFMISGGSMIENRVLEFFNGIGYRLVNGYGMTEIGITSVELSNKRKVINSGSIGKPFTSVEYKIDNGEFYVKGKGISKYIIENGKANQTGEYFKTNDLVEERKGRYYISGRKDDLIVSVTGENVNPNVIEDKFEHRGIRDICLIKSSDNLPVLLVSINRYVDRDAMKDVDKYVRDRIGELNLASQVAGIKFTYASFLKGDDIKKNRKRIAREFEEGKIKVIDVNAEAEKTDHTELEYKIREFFATALNKSVDEVGFNTDFFIDEGGNSLDYMAMITCIRREFGVEFPEINNGELNSVIAIAEFVQGKI